MDIRRCNAICRTGASAIIAFIALAYVPCQPSAAASLSPLDYFSYTYTITFNQTYIDEGEVFYAQLEGVATCTKDAPVHPTEAYIRGRVVGRHLASGTRIALNSGYSTTIASVPSRKGEVITANQEIALYFPPGSPAGEYEITAELIEARFKTGGLWFDATSAFPRQQNMGNAFYKIPEPTPVEPTVTTTPPVTTTAPPVEPTEPTTQPTTTVPSEPTHTDPVEPAEPTTTPLPPTTPTTKPEPGKPFVPPGADDITGIIDAHGVVSGDIYIASADGLASLQVEPGTNLRLPGGEIPAWLMLSRSTSPGQTREEALIVGNAYELSPEDISFEPHGVISLPYYDGQIPAGMDENLLLAARWDEMTNTWIALGSSEVNGKHNTISAPVYQSGIYTVLAPVSGPVFKIDDLQISPSSAAAGEIVSIQCRLTNKGFTAGYYELTLRINGSIQEVKRVSLAGNTSRVISFGVIRNSSGTYNVDVNGVIGSYQITSSQMPTTHSTTIPIQSDADPQATVFYWEWVIYAFNGILLIVLILLARHWLVKKH